MKKYRNKESGQIVCAELVYAEDCVREKTIEEMYRVVWADLSEKEFEDCYADQLVEIKRFEKEYEEIK